MRPKRGADLNLALVRDRAADTRGEFGGPDGPEPGCSPRPTCRTRPTVSYSIWIPVRGQLPSERSPLATERAGVQPRQSVAAARAPDADRHVVADQPPAAACQNRRPAGQTRAVLLANAGGESSNPTRVRVDASADLGAARADGLTRHESPDHVERRRECRDRIGVRETSKNQPFPLDSTSMRLY